MNATFMFYSDAEHVGKLAEEANDCAAQGDKAQALEVLLSIRERYGDLFRLGMRLQDAIDEVSK